MGQRQWPVVADVAPSPLLRSWLMVAASTSVGIEAAISSPDWVSG
jgi:hypothetical protein